MASLMTRDRTTTPASLEPIRLLRDLLNWDPYREANWLPVGAVGTYMPSFEVKETKGAYLIKADLPGINEKDMEINVLGNRLSISGKREQEHKEDTDTYHLMERSFGSFSRTFTLPDEVEADHVHAELKDGILNLTIPKKAGAKAQKVKIQS